MYIKHDDIIWRKVDGEILLLNTNSGHYFALNETAADIWELLINGKSPPEIADALAKQYEQEPRTLMNDVQELIANLTSEQILLAVNK
jgi:hypothetical protein